MAYVLKGRALPEGATEETLGRCIFCGRQVRHFNGERGKNVAFHVYAVRKDVTRVYYYCQEPLCPQLRADRRYEHSIWRCGCVRDYIENVGERCGRCLNPRGEGAPALGDSGKMVHVYNARIVTKAPFEGRQADRLVERVDSILDSDMLFVLDADDSVEVPVEVFGREDWFAGKA